VGLCEPAVGCDGEGEREAAEDDEGEAVFGGGDVGVGCAEVDVDFVEVGVAEGDHD